MKILALSLAYHDSNFCYFDGNRLHYHKLERTTQIKRFAYDNLWEWSYEIKKLWNVNLNEIDEIVLNYDAGQEIKNMPAEIKQVFEGSKAATVLEDQYNPFPHFQGTVWYIGHHYAHSLSTWMLQESADVSIVIDGIGDGRPWSIFKNDKQIDCGSQSSGSIGLQMIQAGSELGIQHSSVNDIAGKLMGFQSYGTIDQTYLKQLDNLSIHDINEIFSINRWINYKKDHLVAKFTALDWISTVHHKIGNVLIEFFKNYASPDDIISYTGGVAQNVIWNTELKRHFKNLIIPPHCADEGLSLGAIEWLRRKNNLPKFKIDNFPYIQNDHCPVDKPTENTIRYAARLLASGKTVGWYQGYGEAGPRALGNRSILLDPRLKNGKEIINEIKQRENYRPFGASILKEHVNQYFDIGSDPFMLFAATINSKDFPAITHIDGTCRLQTVDNSNVIFKQLLQEFYQLTGCPMLLNTSLNVAGKPLAGYPENAKDLLVLSKLDCVFVGNSYYGKN